MAQNQKPQQQTSTGGPTNDVIWTDELKEYLIKLSATSYTVTGLSPNESKFYLTEAQISKILMNTASTFLKEIEECNFVINKRTGDMTGFVWIKENSPDINDSDLRKNDSALNRNVRKYSQGLKEFMDKFCRKNEKRPVDATDSRFVGIPVNLQVVLDLEFDVRGIQYGNKFGDKYRRRTNLNYNAIFEGDKFTCLEVTKKLPDQIRGPRNLRAKRSYNA